MMPRPRLPPTTITSSQVVVTKMLLLERLSAQPLISSLKKVLTMLYKLTSSKGLSEVAAALHVAAQANQFGVMHVHNLKETMAKKGVEFLRECLIFEVCQPQQAKKVLDENMSVSTALPCRISVYEEGGGTVLSMLKPTALLGLFGVPKLEGVARDVEDTMVKIMKEAAA